jgi:hypothetical protein
MYNNISEMHSGRTPQAAGGSCCGRSGSSVLEFGYQLDRLVYVCVCVYIYIYIYMLAGIAQSV